MRLHLLTNAEGVNAQSAYFGPVDGEDRMVDLSLEEVDYDEVIELILKSDSIHCW